MSIQSSAVQGAPEGAALVEILKKRIGAAALGGALVPLAVAGAASTAQAGAPPVPTCFQERCSHVEGDVEQLGPNEFLYTFEVFNTTDRQPEFNPSSTGENVIVNWELPLFSLNGIDTQSITSPENWTYEIIDINGNIILDANGGSGGTSDVYNQPEGPYGEYVWDWVATNDPVLQANPGIYGPDEDQFETPDLILHWFLDPLLSEGSTEGGIFEGDSLGGPEEEDTFSFIAADSATNVPYMASWFRFDPTIGDPPSPQGQDPQPTAAIGIPNNATTSVPEPGTIALFATGLLGLLGLRRRRQAT